MTSPAAEFSAPMAAGVADTAAALAAALAWGMADKGPQLAGDPMGGAVGFASAWSHEPWAGEGISGEAD
jgi:hypothetical protein